MKKISVILLILMLILTFSACGSNKLNKKNIVGTWEADFSIKDYYSMTGKDISASDNELPSQYIERIDQLKISMRIVFKKDGTCDTKIKKSAIDDFYKSTTDIVMDFYKEQGLLMLYQAEGVDVKTNEELEAYFVSNSTSSEEILDALRSTLDTMFEKNKKDLDLGTLGSDGYYTANKKPETFIVEDNAIKITNDNDNLEIMYCESFKKNEFKINKLYVDFEENEVNITYKRVG